MVTETKAGERQELNTALESIQLLGQEILRELMFEGIRIFAKIIRR
jgi:hypothetical protein